MKRKQVLSTELGLLREQVQRRYRSDGGTELEWKSYLPRYSDLNERIRSSIHGYRDVAISPNILRRLFWDTLEAEEASFNIVYLNAFARYISAGSLDYREWASRNSNGDDRAQAVPQESSTGDPYPTPPAPSQGPALPMYEQAEATKATALPAAYHVPDHRVTPSVLHEKHLLSEAARLSWSSFMRPFVIAGLYSGLLSFMFVLTFNEISGYDWPGRGGLGKVMTSYFGSMVFGHIGVGLALAYCARKLSRTTDQRRFFRSFMLFLPPPLPAHLLCAPIVREQRMARERARCCRRVRQAGS